MIDVLSILTIFWVALLCIFILLFVVFSIREGEKRATSMGALAFVFFVALEIGLFYLKRTWDHSDLVGVALLLGGVAATYGGLFLVVRRSPPNTRALQGTQGYILGEVKRFDEREQVFARNRSLPLNSEQYRIFYREHPRLEAFDAKRRQMGGPLGSFGKIDSPHEVPNAAATFSTFSIPQYLGPFEISQPRAHPLFGERHVAMSPEEASTRVKGFARHLGADLVGIALLNSNWVYSRRGEIFYENWDQWGTEIRLNHPYAIVFAMEMAQEMVKTAPHTSSVLESGVIYAKGAFIATQLASSIANLGYSASANHLRHYDVILVPVAVDAGLGEVGRFGYLVTKEYGPRVRLGCVTTDMPLVPDRPVDIGVEDFCTVCKKCARCCPSQSISFDDLREVEITLRWKLNAETCFGHWGKVGTDCNICMRVCPWSHPRTLPHRAIIEIVTRNHFARRLFSSLDDLFYGKKPKPFAGPEWARYC